MIRPEAQAVLSRTAGIWGPCLGLALGLWWVVFSGGLLRLLGFAVVAVSLALALAGWQRWRFYTASDGPGVVKIDEGQIAYLGPLNGGVVARSELSAVSLDHTGRPAHWVLSQPDQQDVLIPVTARGADALFDVFAGLSSLNTEDMLRQLQDKTPRRVKLWQTPLNRPVQPRVTQLRLK